MQLLYMDEFLFHNVRFFHINHGLDAKELYPYFHIYLNQNQNKLGLIM
jgi:hypothetical protein